MNQCRICMFPVDHGRDAYAEVHLDCLSGKVRGGVSFHPHYVRRPTPDPIATILATPCPACHARAGTMCVVYVREFEVQDAGGICASRIRAALGPK